MDTLNTLLFSETELSEDDRPQQNDHGSEYIPIKQRVVPVMPQEPLFQLSTPISDDTETVSDLLDSPYPRSLHRAHSNGQNENDDSEEEQDYRPERERRDQLSLDNQRTILITNLAERTTHKDIVGIVRGGRLLDIFLRGDRSATVSFVEGAADFLAHVKRNDIYLHAKRVRIVNVWVIYVDDADFKTARISLG